MKHWYQFKSKDKRVQGYVPAENEAGMARFAGYSVEELEMDEKAR